MFLHLKRICALVLDVFLAAGLEQENPNETRNKCCGSGMFIPDPGSDFFPSRISDPNCLHPGSRILIKEFKYFNPPKSKKIGF